MVNRRFVLEKMVVKDSGDKSGKGEMYWNFQINGDQFIQSNKSRKNAEKIRDGETRYFTGESRIVEGLSGAKTLKIEGDVSEKDGVFSGQDETARFNHVYNSSNNWGLGSHQVRLQNSPLDVTVYYKLEDA